MPVERDELELVWPGELFAAEGARVLTSGPVKFEMLDALMGEAFADERGSKLLAEVHRRQPPVPPTDTLSSGQDTIELWGTVPPYPLEGGADVLVRELVAHAHELRRWSPRRYWSQRESGVDESSLLSPEAFVSAVANVWDDLYRSGYFEDAFGLLCDDAYDDPAAAGQAFLSRELNSAGLTMWPPVHRDAGVVEDAEALTWPSELVLDAIEALYEVVARPRTRRWHGFGEHWDYDDYSRVSGRDVYTWKVNAVLERSGHGLRLMNSGPEAGRLVRSTNDARDDLTASAVAGGPVAERDEVAHAIELFRDRKGSRETRRSAVVALARVLEGRRELLRKELLSKDEGALFELANKFDLRHRNATQSTDYDEAFLDWIFWWYLSTIELTNTILDAQDGRAAPDATVGPAAVEGS